MEAKFKIGDLVFKGRYDRVEMHVVCPDCGGTKHVLVTLHDGTEITIECGGCDPGGYRGSTGTIKQYAFTTIATPYTVTGVTVRGTGAEYELNNFGGGSYWTSKEVDLFATADEAMAHADGQKAEHEAAENKTLMAKTKDAKSWAWNATYHRSCIRRLEHDLEYHRSKVQICDAKKKEPA